MNCKERLTAKCSVNGQFCPKGYCTFDEGGDVFDCENCDDICKESENCNNCCIQKCFDKLGELEDKLENGTLIELPCKVGGTVFVTPNGKDFYKAKLYGKNEIGAYFVEVYATFIGIPLDKPFYDWHLNTYTKEEAEARLKEL